MGPEDVDFALEITSKEGWGFVRADMERLLSLTPGGSFIARLDGRRVGLLTTVCHKRFCWIGNVAVRAGFRQKGIGRMLVLSALAHARSLGLGRTALVCRDELVGFYEKLGFAGGQAIIGMSGTPGKGRSDGLEFPVVPVTRELLPQVIRLDKAGSGDDRAAMINSFFRGLRSRFLVHLDGKKVDGFIVGKPGANATEIGPWTVRSGGEEAARALFLALVSNLRGPVELYVPARERRVLGFLEDAGLRANHRFREMGIGGLRPRSRVARMLSIAGLEKG